MVVRLFALCPVALAGFSASNIYLLRFFLGFNARIRLNYGNALKWRRAVKLIMEITFEAFQLSEQLRLFKSLRQRVLRM